MSSQTSQNISPKAVGTMDIVWVVYFKTLSSVQFSSVESLSRVRLFVTPWIAARQASLSIIKTLDLDKTTKKHKKLI